MPKKIIGRQMTQEDITEAFRVLAEELSVHDITLDVFYTPNGWISVQARCWDYARTPAVEYKTHSTYITQRGPHFDTVLWQHLTALYHIVDRERAGLPRRIGD